MKTLNNMKIIQSSRPPIEKCGPSIKDSYTFSKSNTSVSKCNSNSFSKSIRESIHASDSASFPVVEGVPIAQVDVVNQNNRMYSRKLWEKLILEKQGENSYALTDHPQGNEIFDGSVQNILGIWRNLRIDEGGYVRADLVVAGPKGKEFFEFYQAGGEIGMSLYGYGEVEEKAGANGQICEYIVEDQFTLVRTGDWVLYPSNNIYFSSENEDSSRYYYDKLKEENKVDNNEVKEQSVDDLIKETVGEEKILQAESTNDLSRKKVLLSQAERLLENLENTDAIATLRDKCKVLSKELNEQLDKGHSVSDSDSKLSEKYENLLMILEDVRDRYSYLKQNMKMLEGELNGRPKAHKLVEARKIINGIKSKMAQELSEKTEQLKELSNELEASENEKKKLDIENVKIVSKLRTIESKYEELIENSDVLEEEYRRVSDRCKDQEATIRKLSERAVEYRKRESDTQRYSRLDRRDSSSYRESRQHRDPQEDRDIDNYVKEFTRNYEISDAQYRSLLNQDSLPAVMKEARRLAKELESDKELVPIKEDFSDDNIEDRAPRPKASSNKGEMSPLSIPEGWL